MSEHDVYVGRLPQTSLDGKLSIHSQKSRKFMEEIGAPQLAMAILRDGYKLPLSESPANYFEENNKSAIMNDEFVREKISQWENKGYCHKVAVRPPITSPLSVASKIDLASGELKLRVCLDPSRHLNKYLIVKPTKLADLHISEKQIEKEDFMCAFDLENCYFHVSIHPEHHKYLGFKLDHPETREPVYYCFSVMIYGLSPAAGLITYLTNPLMAHIHTQGIRSSIMIDDGRTLGTTAAEAKKNHMTVLEVFQLAGWNIQWKKTSNDPTQTLYHQGFTTDTKSMTYSIPTFKIEDLEDRIEKLISPTTVTHLAQVTGKLASVQRAVGPIVPIMIRSSYQVIASHVEALGEEAWHTVINIPDIVVQDLNFLKTCLRQYNVQPIVNGATGFCLNSEVRSQQLVRPVLAGEYLGGVWAGDASKFQAAAYDVNNPNQVHLEYFEKEQIQTSSSSRELVTVETTLKHLETKLEVEKPTLVYWMTDSQVLCTWLTKGTSIEPVRIRIVKLYKHLHKLRLRLVPIWVPREDLLIQLADCASKHQDTDDWGLNSKSFKIIQELSPQEFTLDVFANCTNKQVHKFFSKVASPGSAGINAFMQDWSDDFVYACPPVKLVIETFRHIVKTGCKGVLVVPNWPRNVFWPVITQDGRHISEVFTRFWRFRPQLKIGRWCDESLFKINPRPEMLALFFDLTVDSTQKINTDRCLAGGCSKCG